MLKFLKILEKNTASNIACLVTMCLLGKFLFYNNRSSYSVFLIPDW